MINNRDKLKKTATDLNIEFPKNIKNERLLKLIEEKQGNKVIPEEVITEEVKEVKDTKVITNNKYNDNELIIAVRKKDINAIKKILKEDNKQAQFKNDEGLTAYEIAWNQECSYEILYLFKNNT
jgi:hypothetical protein